MTEQLEHIEDYGTITQVIPGKVKLELIRGAGCKSCSLHGFCFSKNTPAEFWVDTDLSFELGQRVELEISAKGRVLASLAIFIMPLVLLFVAFLIASLFFIELVSAIIGFAAFAGGFVALKYLNDIYGKALQIHIKSPNADLKD